MLNNSLSNNLETLNSTKGLSSFRIFVLSNLLAYLTIKLGLYFPWCLKNFIVNFLQRHFHYLSIRVRLEFDNRMQKWWFTSIKFWISPIIPTIGKLWTSHPPIKSYTLCWCTWLWSLKGASWTRSPSFRKSVPSINWWSFWKWVLRSNYGLEILISHQIFRDFAAGYYFRIIEEVDLYCVFHV